MQFRLRAVSVQEPDNVAILAADRNAQADAAEDRARRRKLRLCAAGQQPLGEIADASKTDTPRILS